MWVLMRIDDTGVPLTQMVTRSRDACKTSRAAGGRASCKSHQRHNRKTLQYREKRARKADIDTGRDCCIQCGLARN